MEFWSEETVAVWILFYRMITEALTIAPPTEAAFRVVASILR
jgi:hypothetical protein